SQIPEFEKADKAPDTIYANAVWLAQQTELTAQQIGSLLQEGLDEIGTESDPQTRIDDLKDLLTGQGGVTSLSTTLKNEIDAFQGKVSSFYTTLNTELNGDTNSLKWYLGQSSNVLVDAKQAVAADQTQIDKLTRNIKTLNDEYIGFTTAASVSPLFFLFPFFGIFLAIADAATFGVLATQTKTALDQARQDLSTAEDDDQKKAALVTQLSQFDDRSQDVETDGKDFLDAIGQLTSGWDAFEAQINLRLQSLTADDVADWGKFMDTTNFETAKDGWKLIETTAESFRDAGFAQFSIQASP
ncbi:MAG TPA: hypothetical protein VKB09_12760, partial [Thermomicrobiales bacterium]|nr:hypothetical protein [Thermomicrobiales bacterium]